jgi:DNA-binding transcriptional regulator LsrR (DeoR family)
MENKRQVDRNSLLADVAEMYFLEGKNQAEIARKIGVTRSNVSRMLTEARNAGIIQIQINRPLKEDPSLGQALVECFGLMGARIIDVDQSNELLEKLGKVAGDELTHHLKPGWVLGTSWGTAISASVEQMEVPVTISDLKVVQLLGALGARIKEYDGHAIVRRLEAKLDADGIYLNAPFLVDDAKMAKSLLENRGVEESLSFGKRADIALLGVGSSELQHCSYYLADYVTREEIIAIQKTGAIGDVCGRFYDLHGNIAAEGFQKRLIGIALNDLMRIPVRIGVAGGPAKVNPIIGALRGGFINILVTDTATALQVLERIDH